jgi:hypothetical protein
VKSHYSTSTGSNFPLADSNLMAVCAKQTNHPHRQQRVVTSPISFWKFYPRLPLSIIYAFDWFGDCLFKCSPLNPKVNKICARFQPEGGFALVVCVYSAAMIS